MVSRARRIATLLFASALVSCRGKEGGQAPHDVVIPPPAVAEKPAIKPLAAPFAGLDLTRLRVDGDQALAALPSGERVELTLDPTLQRAAEKLLEHHRFDRAGVVMVDVEDGHVLAWASRRTNGSGDVNLEANVPAASLFKMVTGAALVEHAHLSPDTETCYSGGFHNVGLRELKERPGHEDACASLSLAMGKSLNTVFARLAVKHLKPAVLEHEARRLGFGAPVPFDLTGAASDVHVPSDTLGFARTAAGFANSTTSPLHAAVLAATFARGGDRPEPHIVERVVDATGAVRYERPAPKVDPLVAPEVARAVGRMMEATVEEGTSRKAFHHGDKPWLATGVAGKTGTLNVPDAGGLVTWFAGFTERTRGSTRHPVAIATLVVSGPLWDVKANVLARDVLRAWEKPEVATAWAEGRGFGDAGARHGRRGSRAKKAR
jgi:cell division protein FtsI/penicillin-binding protein 2